MKHKVFLHSLKNAFRGICSALRRERNMRLHLIGAALALAASFYFRIEKYEFLFVLAAIALVLISEMLNTALEAAVDLKTLEFHPLARLAKNVAAGAVLCATLFALIVGCIVFAGRLKDFFIP
ncbi:MAG: diacylglycerol kinase family protein [Firmicutes bacterium]|nr:diacylglycerol kinase family protein [Bacillota bacterium]